ncbi:MAG: S8 family serine peptidase [Tessaracoccus sp.]|uniref:S8 family serine peptidase n=1 Tax=Tessaracoccus sp. TaxID=1971211 RepID=UPI001EC1C236|nr:S8 family serine peptidase [Tessaracoccus sp.]MBK7820509.1 S8 family serine peptidase [Tessaracoccus sp.]
MKGIDVLRLLLAARDPDAEVTGLDLATLRFVVEFRTVIDIDAVKGRIADLLETEPDSFQFYPLFDGVPDEQPPAPSEAEFGEFYVLQFPGLDRTVDNEMLFAMGYELADELDAVTVEPDLGTQIYVEPLPPDAAPEGVIKGAFAGTCFVDTDPPKDTLWALERAGVLSAWAASPARGAGISIAQPDTGVTKHVELSDVDQRDGFNILTNRPDPTDPLAANGFPGHGTSTASVAVSGAAGQVNGSAPGATLIPIRAVESVILLFNGSAIAKAVDHARRHGAHVITMSLGGTPSRAMRQAINNAIAEGIIVLAAAGNCVRLVVYPARYDEVIAVAGSNVRDLPWRGSCRGPRVDITAPGENVWRAVAGPTGTDTAGGQGTSFAVALTAGTAALWLSHHGVEEVREAAAQRGTTVQQLFRESLVATARTPANWDTSDFGVGIVDAGALLARPLDSPRPIHLEAAPGAPPPETLELLAEAWGAVDAVRLSGVATDPRFQLELSTLALEDARVGAAEPGGAESSMARNGVSPQLAAAIGPTTPPPAGRTTPTTRADPVLAPDPVVLVATRTGGLEAAADISPEAARDLLAANRDAPVDAISERLKSVRASLAKTERAAQLKPLHDQLLRDTRRVVKRLSAGKPVPDDIDARVGLEALVQLEGRPALRMTDDVVDPDDPGIGEWAGALLLQQDRLRGIHGSIGRIDTAGGAHAGTGFVVGDGLVMTNRHVLETLAFPAPRRVQPTTWVLHGRPTINFSPSGKDPSRTFAIREVAFSGPNPADVVNFANLDLALLRIEKTNTDGEPPPPLRLSDMSAGEGAKLFVIGYPAMPTALPSDEEGRRRMDVVRRLGEIYGTTFGVRYLSPGLVMQTPTQFRPDDPNPRVFTHDATSLGGNSGSCVLSFDDNLDVAGLHFAGDWLRANFAHAMDGVHAEIAGFLR